MELKEGYYARTKDGEILKIKHIEDVYTSDGIYIANVIYFGDCFHINSDEVIKSSPDIIDLIEDGDYVLVEGEDTFLKVKYIDSCKGSMRELYFEEDGMGMGYWDEQIKSIVTKEQFESISYKVEE